MRWGLMTNKVFLLVFLLSINGLCYFFVMEPDSSIRIKDTVIDCDHIKVYMSFKYYQGGNNRYLMADDKQNDTLNCQNLSFLKCLNRVSCKHLGQKDLNLPVHFDSIKIINEKKQKKELFFKNGKIVEENFYSKKKGERVNRIFIYDTTMNDTNFKIILNSKYRDDDLIYRSIESDTLQKGK